MCGIAMRSVRRRVGRSIKGGVKCIRRLLRRGRRLRRRLFEGMHVRSVKSVLFEVFDLMGVMFDYGNRISILTSISNLPRLASAIVSKQNKRISLV
jgi:hypothetical protein